MELNHPRRTEYRYEATKIHSDPGARTIPFVYVTSDPDEIAEIEWALYGINDDEPDLNDEEPDGIWCKQDGEWLIEIEA